MKLTGILKAEWEDADRIHLAHDRDHWLPFVNASMNVWAL
jgi:hypothetical protein